MYRVVESVSLHDEHARAFRVFRIILRDGGPKDSVYDFPSGEPIFHKLIVSVF